ncbi:hypothetical protein O3M35_011689 [Rhynocoris fuscipes]|uniref:CUB domain-containing protein n=1 Tax=Rhynocoris fuscipes TaxID=488301 RepID=A0AAW1CX66_9HEMI
MRVLKHRDENGIISRTVILPKETFDWNEFDNNFILISDSNSKPASIETTKQSSTIKEEEADTSRKRRKKKKPQQVQRTTSSPMDITTLLNLFTIIKFSNDECASGGRCYHQSECKSMGGTASAPCANGYGVCCQFDVECGGTGPMDGEIFVGGNMAGVCTMTVEKKECAKQMRFDFLDLEMEDPVEGACVSERLLITGQNTNSVVPVICGFNTGQHMYVDVDESKGPVMLTVISPEKKTFKIRIKQICDGDSLEAPRNCLQYYSNPSGAIQSFNYRREVARTSSYMNNLNYAICIRKAPGMCSIVYSNLASDGEEFPFEMNNMDIDGSLTVPPKEAGAEIFNCPDDYIVVANVRLCGQKLNDATTQLDYTQNYPITDTSNGPFNVHVVSDSSVSGRGFYMNYQQQPC